MSAFEETAQFKSGRLVEIYLDTFARRHGWSVQPTTPYEERVLCIGDRHYSRDGERLTVEYKSGLQTAFTGNVFLETVSVDTAGKPGWVYSCNADVIIYAALGNGLLLYIRPDQLRLSIDGLKRRFRELATAGNQNDGYNSKGVIVPLAVASRELAYAVVHVEIPEQLVNRSKKARRR